MSNDELSEGHRAIVRQLAREVAEGLIADKRLVMDGDLRNRVEEIAEQNGYLTEAHVERAASEEGGKPKIPSSERATERARDAISSWRKSRPPWWDIRKRIDTRVAGAGIVGVISLLAVDWLWQERAMLPEAMHWVAGTEAKFVEMVEAWHNGSRSDIATALNEALDTKLARWSAAKDFHAVTSSAIASLASTGDASLRTLVQQTLDDNPILIFHGQGVLGLERPVQIVSNGAACDQHIEDGTDVVTDVHGPLDSDAAFTSMKASTQDFRAALAACRTAGKLVADSTIDVPFFARFHGNETLASDEVFVVVHVNRQPNPDLATAVLAADTGATPADHDYVSPLRGKLGRLEVEYHTANTNFADKPTLKLNSLLPHQGNNFFYGKINDAVAGAFPKTSLGETDAQELIHSVSVSLPGVAAGAEEIVQTRVLIFVNKTRI